MNFKNIIFLFCLFSLVACHADFEEVIDNSNSTEEPQIIITTEITGKVNDADGNLVNDYSLIMGGNLKTQLKSYFLEQVELVNKRGQYLSIEQDGLFKAFASLLLIENDINLLDLHLFPELQSKDLILDNALSLTSFSSIEFKQINNSSGVSHSGSANLSIRDLSEGKYDKQLGEFGYINNDLLALQPIDRFYFALDDNAGNVLEIAEDEPAFLRFEGNNTNRLGLFQFDPDRSAWLFIDDLINGQVSLMHSGYYMLAEYQDGIFTEGELFLESAPLSYQKHAWNSSDYTTTTYTSLGGKFFSVVPAMSDLDYKVLDPCNKELRTLNYASTEDHVNDLSFTIQNTDNAFYNLNTSVLQCDGELSSEPAISIFVNNGNFIYPFNDTQIDTWLSICNNAFEVSAYNIKDGTSGPSFSWTTEIAAELSYLSNCQEHEDGYSFIKIRNDKKLYKAFSFDKEDGKTFLTAQDDALKLIVKGTDIGPYNVEELNIKIDDLNFGANGYAINCENSTQGCGIEEAFVSHYEETNDGWIRITFSGEAWMQTITPAAAGNFPIEGIILCKAN